jgi:hypothetical protein
MSSLGRLGRLRDQSKGMVRLLGKKPKQKYLFSGSFRLLVFLRKS